jgi:hypothetical protein
MPLVESSPVREGPVGTNRLAAFTKFWKPPGQCAGHHRRYAPEESWSDQVEHRLPDCIRKRQHTHTTCNISSQP